MEGRGFRDLKPDFDASNALVFGVSFDSAADNLKFARKYDFNFPLLCDTTRAMGVAYGAAASASASKAARVGVIIDVDGRVLDYRAKVDAGTYPAEALRLVRAKP